VYHFAPHCSDRRIEEVPNALVDANLERVAAILEELSLKKATSYGYWRSRWILSRLRAE